MGMREVDHRELLDGDGDVVGFVDADGIAHEFAFGEDEVGEEYPFESAAELGKSRTRGEPIILPDGMAEWLE